MNNDESMVRLHVFVNPKRAENGHRLSTAPLVAFYGVEDVEVY